MMDTAVHGAPGSVLMLIAFVPVLAACDPGCLGPATPCADDTECPSSHCDPVRHYCTAAGQPPSDAGVVDGAADDASACGDGALADGPVPIFRSVGPASTGPLATGAGNALEIDDGRATFASPLPDNVGVGDVIQYNPSSGSAPDNLAFIRGRVSERQFLVANAAGGDAAPTTAAGAIESWSVCRAYASLAEAMALSENTCIDPALRNFDDENSGYPYDLVARNQSRHIAAYADAVDTDLVVVGQWTTDSGHRLHVYTPTDRCQVGASQRHAGRFDPNRGYLLDIDVDGAQIDCAIKSYTDVLHFEGLQVRIRGATASNVYAVRLIPSSTPDDHVLEVSHCIIVSAAPAGSSGIIGLNGAGRGDYRFWNNLIYSVNPPASESYAIFASANAASRTLLANNTLVGWNYGVRINGNTLGNQLFNNLAVNHSRDYLGDNGALTSPSSTFAHNLSLDGTSPDSDFRYRTVLFVDGNGHDYHLAAADTAARDQGADLGQDVDIAVHDDIDGDPRPSGDSGDIGADEVR